MHTIHILGGIIFGGYFVWSGYNHFRNHKMLSGYAASMKIPSPVIAVLGTGVLMVLGGLGIIFSGYLSATVFDISLLLIIIFLVPTTFAMHAFWKHTDAGAKMTDYINFSKNFALVGAALMLMM